MDIVLGFDYRDGVAARLVQEPKVAVSVDGGQESVPPQAVPAHDAPLVVAECTQRARNLEDARGIDGHVRELAAVNVRGQRCPHAGFPGCCAV